MRSFSDLADEAAVADVSGWSFDWLDRRATDERPSWGYSRLLASRLAHVASALDIDTGGGEIIAEVPQLPSRMVVTEGWPPNIERARRLLSHRGVDVVPVEPKQPLPFPEAGFELVSSRHDIGAVIYILRKCVWWVPDFDVDRYRRALERLDAHIREHGAFVATPLALSSKRDAHHAQRHVGLQPLTALYRDLIAFGLLVLEQLGDALVIGVAGELGDQLVGLHLVVVAHHRRARPHRVPRHRLSARPRPGARAAPARSFV